MCELLIPALPEVKDEDVRWSSRLLGFPERAFLGEDGSDPRCDIVKSMESIDVEACPGSGKTTLVVAKLAILAEKWTSRTRGICVLSHTNAARYAFESKLVNAGIPCRILSYPHFIGTIHAFANKFLAIPWLRSRGFPVKVIDDDLTLSRRWKSLPYSTRSALERKHKGRLMLTIKEPDFGVGEVPWGRGGTLGHATPTYQDIRRVCHQSVKDGYHCHSETFVWSEELIKSVPGVIESLRNRFPLYFLDEAQDNSEEQSAFLHRLFISGGTPVIRQRFGDSNQAIFGFIGESDPTTDQFLDAGEENDLPDSYRFGQGIADFAGPLGVKTHAGGLRGRGPTSKLASGGNEARHTIFLFDDDRADRVLSAYAELLLATFSDRELREGEFSAIGQVHMPPEYEERRKFPHHLRHYWQGYDPHLAPLIPKPRTFVEHVFVGAEKAELSGESYSAVHLIADGILKLAEMGGTELGINGWDSRHRHILELLEKDTANLARYRLLISRFALKKKPLSLRQWTDRWREIVRSIAESTAQRPLSGSEVESFLDWPSAPVTDVDSSVSRRSQVNLFCYPKETRAVHIRLASIHSVKGETHTATLVLETYWHKHNLSALRPWLCGERAGWRSSDGVRQRSRLKVHYVAMTRPTHLLCLAMKRSTFVEKGGALEDRSLGLLQRRGWQIKEI